MTGSLDLRVAARCVLEKQDKTPGEAWKPDLNGVSGCRRAWGLNA